MNVSHCQNMTNTCNLEVYTENPFYLLGLSPFASNRTIRRKKQDFESANALGNKQWENEFNHLLGLRSVPTFDKVNETFLKLEDPRSRIIYEIFWFWPLDDNEDVASNLLHVGRVDDSMKIWAYEEQSTAPHRALIATHNIAVFYHLYAIDAERQFIKNNASSFFYPKEHKKMCDYWQKSLSRWEKLLNSSSFWDILQKRIKDIDDSRLTPQFIQQVRNELPCSLNRINANFVLEYAKRSDKKNEITRHITYVKDFYQGYDRIQSILESVIEPIERDINLMIRQAEQDCAAKPQNALSVAKHLFKSTKHPLGILSQIFESQNVKKCKIVDTIITVCNRCLVAYCNKTNKFEETILFLEEILPLANNLDLKKLLNDNLKIFKDNFEEYKLTHYCWFCQKHEAEPTYNINVEMRKMMMGRMPKEFIYVKGYWNEYLDYLNKNIKSFYNCK